MVHVGDLSDIAAVMVQGVIGGIGRLLSLGHTVMPAVVDPGCGMDLEGPYGGGHVVYVDPQTDRMRHEVWPGYYAGGYSSSYTDSSYVILSSSAGGVIYNWRTQECGPKLWTGEMHGRVYPSVTEPGVWLVRHDDVTMKVPVPEGWKGDPLMPQAYGYNGIYTYRAISGHTGQMRQTKLLDTLDGVYWNGIGAESEIVSDIRIYDSYHNRLISFYTSPMEGVSSIPLHIIDIGDGSIQTIDTIDDVEKGSRGDVSLNHRGRLIWFFPGVGVSRGNQIAVWDLHDKEMIVRTYLVDVPDVMHDVFAKHVESDRSSYMSLHYSLELYYDDANSDIWMMYYAHKMRGNDTLFIWKLENNRFVYKGQTSEEICGRHNKGIVYNGKKYGDIFVPTINSWKTKSRVVVCDLETQQLIAQYSIDDIDAGLSFLLLEMGG